MHATDWPLRAAGSAAAWLTAAAAIAVGIVALQAAAEDLRRGDLMLALGSVVIYWFVWIPTLVSGALVGAIAATTSVLVHVHRAGSIGDWVAAGLLMATSLVVVGVVGVTVPFRVDAEWWMYAVACTWSAAVAGAAVAINRAIWRVHSPSQTAR
ncbi:hypothetical protein GCM10009846_22700 [Agrococcus versicolor]|uniref:Uncharacterized protein n=1 Tax=Agrococcus versicolor TaxID=501482 RepID=A0ABP5MJU9_9MICO